MESKNLLFIDRSLRDYQVFVDSVNPETYAIVYDAPLPEYEAPEGTFDRIGIVFSNTPDPQFLGKPFFESILPELIQKYQVKVVDFLACNTLLDPAWLDYYAFLKSETGVTIGASDDLTGNLKYGGDWIMESTSQDIEPIYFTQKIEYYQYLLDFSITTLLSLNGLLWGVGNNAYGQLGVGDTAGRQVFTNLTQFQTPAFKALSIQSHSTAYSTKITPVGMGHTVLLMDDNSVWGAGANNVSQLGRVSGSTLQFQPLSGYTGIPYLVATGPTHTMIATKNNASYELWATGSATTYGAVYLFNGAMKSSVFVKLNAVNQPIVSIVSNEDHNIILYGSSIYALGYNGMGQLGTGNTSTSATFNLPVSATSVEATAYSTLFLSNGSVYGTGAAQYNGSSVQTNTFQLCATNASVLSGGLEHVLLLKRDNTLWGCGNNNSGQLTLSTTSFTPIPFNYGTIQSIQAGWKQSLVINTDQRIFATGNNLYGQLGTNTTANVSQFQEVFFPLLFTPSAGATNTSITVTGVNTRNFSSIVCGGRVIPSVVNANSVVFRAPALSGNVSVGVQYKTSTLKTLLSSSLFAYQNQNASTVSASGPARTSFVIQGSFLNPVRVVFGTQDASFVQVGGIVQATAPVGTGNVSIQLIDSLQNVASAGTFQYQNASVTSVGPLTGTTGTSMTLRGSFLNSSRVVFGTRDASFVNVSTGINLSVPSGAGNVSVQLIDALQNTLTAGIFQYQNASVTQMTPTQGTTRTPVTISGEYLNPVRVLFGSRDASFNVSSQIKVSVPSGSGNVSVVLIDALQNITFASNFDYQNPSGSILPSFGTTQTPITIPITNLDPIQVLFGGQDISFNVSMNGSNLFIKAPAGTGNVSVTVVDRLQNIIDVGEFVYQNASVYEMIPSFGTRNTPVTITGTYLNPDTLLFGPANVSFVNTSGTINLIVPDGSGNVSVQWADALLNTGDAGIFAYHNPSLSYVTALAGPTHTLLTLYGEYLETFTHLYYEEETPVTESPIVLSILNTTGVLSMIGVDALDNEWPIEFDLTTLIPHVTEVAPGIAGQVATFYGGLLGNTSQVFFEEDVSLVQVSSGFVQVTIPPGYGQVPVSLLDTNGYVAQATFTYLFPKINSLSVPGAPTNTNLTLRGTNLIDTVEVWFGNTSTTFSATLTAIQASVPVGIGNVSVSAVDQYGQRALFDGLFTFRNPIVTDLRPRRAPSNSALTIAGNYLSEISTVYFGDLATQEFAGFVDTLYVTVPVATGTVPIRVVDRYGNQANASGFFTFDAYPIKRVYPLEGVRHDYVEIEADLETISSVTFGNTLAQVYQLTNHFWVAQVPGQVPSGGIVKIQDPAGKCGLWPVPFRLKIPVVESADVSGNVLTLQGTGFGVVETVVVQTLSAPYEKTETEIILELPCGCDHVDLVDARGNRVTYPLVYEGPPVVEGPITLTTMTPAGPEFYRLRIEGTNFLHANGESRISEITLQNAPVTNLDIVSSSLLYCTAPGGVGRSHLEVFDEFGEEVPTTLLYFYLIPGLTDVSPNQGMENMYIYFYGTLLQQVKHVLIGEYNAKFVCMDHDCLQVRIPPGTGTQSIALVDLAYNIHLTPYEFTYSDLQSRICFPAGTTVQTDQGIVEIQTIGSNHSIDGKRVVALTKTYGMDADLVCIRRGALRKNYPNKTTLITRCHRLWLKGELVSAQRLLEEPGFSLVPYTGEKLYNVLLEKEGRMKVHGMWVETLDPINPIAKFFNGEK